MEIEKIIDAIFIDIITSDGVMLIGRAFLFPIITLLLYYLFLMIFTRIKFFNNKLIIDNFFLNFQFSRMYAVNLTTLVLNGYWFYLLYNNSITSIKWDFIWELTNIYLQLLPFILSNILLIVLYNRARKTILNIL